MAGNALEWCLNEYDSLNVVMDGDELRGLRGGAFSVEAYLARCAARDYIRPSYIFDFIGFRGVCAAAP